MQSSSEYFCNEEYRLGESRNRDALKKKIERQIS